MGQRGRTRWMVGLGVAAALYGSWKAGAWLLDLAGGGGGKVAIANQMWIERMPRDGRDLVRQLAFVEHRGRRFGAVARASHWRVRADRFLWSVDADRDADRIDLEFPQTSDRVGVRARAWRCEGEAPKPFEICLELSRDGRALRLYSRDDWRIRPGGEALELDGDAPIGRALLDVPGAPGTEGPATSQGAPTGAPPAGEALGALFD